MTDEHEDGEVVLGMVFPFVVTASNGGIYDDEAFVAGCQFGQIENELSMSMPVDRYVYTPLVPQVDLAAMHHGYIMTATPWEDAPDEWTLVEFESVDDTDIPTVK